MRFRRRAVALAVAFAALAFVPAAQADILISVDKAAQKMTVTVDGEQRYTWPVSTGIADYDTPDGDFKAFRMDRDHFSREWDDAPMPYSIFFTKQGHAIHGTYHKTIGRPASHGCVRLSVANAATLFNLVKEKGLNATRVVLTGEIPADTGNAVARRAPAPRATTPRYADDDDYAAQAPVRDARNWRDDRAQQYYYYRDQPYRAYAPPPPRPYYGYERRPPFPFGW